MIVLLTDVLLPGRLVWRQNLTVKKRPLSIPSTTIDHISYRIAYSMMGNCEFANEESIVDDMRHGENVFGAPFPESSSHPMIQE